MTRHQHEHDELRVFIPLFIVYVCVCVCVYRVFVLSGVCEIHIIPSSKLKYLTVKHNIIIKFHWRSS